MVIRGAIPVGMHGYYYLLLFIFIVIRRSEDTALFLLKEVYQESNPVLIKS